MSFNPFENMQLSPLPVVEEVVHSEELVLELSETSKLMDSLYDDSLEVQSDEWFSAYAKYESLLG